jgi:hypothetical protein
MKIDDSIRGLIQAYLDGLLSDEERTALFAALRNSPEAAREFACRTRLESALGQTLKPEPAWSVRDFENEADRAPETRWKGHRPGPQRMDHLWGPASALLLHAAVLLIILRWTLPGPNPSDERLTQISIGRDLAPLEPFEESLPEFSSRAGLIPDLATAMPTESFAPAAPDAISGIPRLAALPPAAAQTTGSSRLDAPDGFATRTGTARSERHAQAAPGWGERAEIAALAGLEWMGSEQGPDGAWSGTTGAEVRATALGAAALLAFAPVPADAQGRSALQAIRFLESRQGPDGQFDADPSLHALATLVFAEAWALWRLPEFPDRLQAATGRLLQEQECKDFGTSARAVSGSEAGWQAHALALLLRLHPEREEIRLAAAHLTGILKTRYDPARGLFLLSGPVSAADRNRISAMVVSALQILGEGQSAECTQARQYLLRQSPSTLAADFAQSSPESLFFLFDALTRQAGPEAAGWLSGAARTVLAAQDASGAWPDGQGRKPPLHTAATVLALSAHVRHPKLLSLHPPGSPEWIRLSACPVRKDASTF